MGEDEWVDLGLPGGAWFPGYTSLVLGEGGGHKDAVSHGAGRFLREHPAEKTGPERGRDLPKVTQPVVAELGC